uniref:Uncharacterized protein n=1 Tax=Arundo donax TaxID=35708 RepID=A0A0A8Y871_ARUDO
MASFGSFSICCLWKLMLRERSPKNFYMRRSIFDDY